MVITSASTRLRTKAGWTVFLDGCHADWRYREHDSALFVPGTRLWDKEGHATAIDPVIVVAETLDPYSEALIEEYEDRGPVLVFGGLPHGSNRIADLTFGLGGDGAVALLGHGLRRFVVPGLDEDESFALFADDHRALAHMDMSATQEALGDACEEFLHPTRLSFALSDMELDALRNIDRQGFMPICDDDRFDPRFLASAGLGGASRGGVPALVVRDEKAFESFREMAGTALSEDMLQEDLEMAAIGLVRVKSVTPDGKVEHYYRPGVAPEMRSRWKAAVTAYMATLTSENGD